ncbi:MAG: hypothetical protein AMJ59_06910 [Gammaproteobacteria bacterium SG8_31]|nr:MAG: hypothetical protein AMJ59_06910 [Gammaproteobacteria bacterium SG8_31]
MKRISDLSAAAEALAEKVNPAVVEIMVSGYGVFRDRQAGGIVAGASPLRSGDVIYAVNGAPIETVSGLHVFVQATPAGKPLVLQVERHGRLQYLVTLRD